MVRLCLWMVCIHQGWQRRYRQSGAGHTWQSANDCSQCRAITSRHKMWPVQRRTRGGNAASRSSGSGSLLGYSPVSVHHISIVRILLGDIKGTRYDQREKSSRRIRYILLKPRRSLLFSFSPLMSFCPLYLSLSFILHTALP